MLNSLGGRISEKGAGRFALESGPVEWDLEASFTTIQALPPVGGTARVFTYLHHREDVLKLYGFATTQERLVFLDLLKVDGIGPRQALRILSGTSVDRFAAILEAGDTEELTRIPGLGLKTAQKVILALKGKLRLESPESERGGDIVAALADMGFDRRKAGAVVRQLLDGAGDEAAREQELFRAAIVKLSQD